MSIVYVPGVVQSGAHHGGKGVNVAGERDAVSLYYLEEVKAGDVGAAGA